MPELPEVETVCQALRPVLENQSLLHIQLNRPNLRYPFPLNFESALAHQSILSVRRRAKYLLVDFRHDLTLVWHLGMSGRVIIEGLQTPFLKLSPHDHVIFMTSGNHKIIYRDPRRFGFMLLTSTSQLEKLHPFNTLGPEPLDNSELAATHFYENLKNRAISIKSALLDQKIIAGVGNIYASEALWQAKLSPLRLANTFTFEEVACLLKELQDVLKRAIAAGGSTLRDHIRPNGERGYFQHNFKVYDRENLLCNYCKKTLVSKIVQNGRATYYCSKCQN